MTGSKTQRLREKRNKKRVANLEDAVKHAEGWNKYTFFHWYKSINGIKIDWWPSTRKAMFNGVVYRNVMDINELIKHLKGEK